MCSYVTVVLCFCLVCVCVCVLAAHSTLCLNSSACTLARVEECDTASMSTADRGWF